MITDALGNPITEDAMVIYNLSGELSRGLVIRVVEKYKQVYREQRFCGFIEIEHYDDHTKVSKVRNPKSIIVIYNETGYYFV